MSIVLVGSTSGSITLQEPAVAGTTVLTLPATSGNVVVDGATQTLTNKTLTSPTLTTPNIDSAQFATVSGTAPIYPCRAWVNFNGTGTPAIRASGNVSSITDNGTGTYTVNFTTALPDANYAAFVDMTPSASNAGSDTFPITYLTTSIEVRHFEDNVLRDSTAVNVSVFR